eukprot:6655452-Pyramimonas_sp.AAC.1
MAALRLRLQPVRPLEVLVRRAVRALAPEAVEVIPHGPAAAAPIATTLFTQHLALARRRPRPR